MEDTTRIHIVSLREAFELQFSFNLFDSDFLEKHPNFVLKRENGIVFQISWLKSAKMGTFDFLIVDIKSQVEHMKSELYAKHEYIPDYYDKTLEIVKNLLDYRYDHHVLLNNIDSAKEVLKKLCEKHAFDLSIVNKKDAVIYLYKKGYRLQKAVNDLPQWEYDEIVQSHSEEKENLAAPSSLPKTVVSVSDKGEDIVLESPPLEIIAIWRDRTKKYKGSHDERGLYNWMITLLDFLEGKEMRELRKKSRNTDTWVKNAIVKGVIKLIEFFPELKGYPLSGRRYESLQKKYLV